MTARTPKAKRSGPSAHEASSASSASGAAAIEARGLAKTFGTNRAVDRIDLTVMEGETSGCSARTVPARP
jgi:hypothetical protein